MNVQIFQYKQAGRLRTRSFFDSVISDNLPKNEFANSISYFLITENYQLILNFSLDLMGGNVHNTCAIP